MLINGWRMGESTVRRLQIGPVAAVRRRLARLAQVSQLRGERGKADREHISNLVEVR